MIYTRIRPRQMNTVLVWLKYLIKEKRFFILRFDFRPVDPMTAI